MKRAKKFFRPTDPAECKALDHSLRDAYRIARRLVRYPDLHQVALGFVRALRECGAQDQDDAA